MKNIHFILLIAVFLQGCIVSDRVSTIGQRIYVIHGVKENEEKFILVNVDEYAAETPEKDKASIPYTHEMTLGPKIQTMEGKIWKNGLTPGNKTVTVDIDGSDYVFLIPSGKLDAQTIDNAVMNGKKWYFLPSQGLQILAIPADITIDAIIISAILGIH